MLPFSIFQGIRRRVTSGPTASYTYVPFSAEPGTGCGGLTSVSTTNGIFTQTGLSFSVTAPGKASGGVGVGPATHVGFRAGAGGAGSIHVRTSRSYTGNRSENLSDNRTLL